MITNFAADAGWLEDVHRLNEERLGHAKRFHNRGEVFLTRELVKFRIQIMQGVPDLVDRLAKIAL